MTSAGRTRSARRGGDVGAEVGATARDSFGTIFNRTTELAGTAMMIAGIINPLTAVVGYFPKDVQVNVDPNSFASAKGEAAFLVGSVVIGPGGGLAKKAETTAIKVTEKGLARIEAHLARLNALDDPANAAMLQRLREGARTAEDIAFYLHELKESAIMARGVAAREAHLLTLQWQGIAYKAGYEARLYHASVINTFREWFNPAAWPK